MNNQNIKALEQELFSKVVFGNVGKFEEFIKLHPDVNIDAKNEKGETPLIKAAKVDNKEMVSALANAGADVNAEDNKQETPLMKAARRGLLFVIQALHKRGAKLNTKNNAGETALIILAGNNLKDAGMRFRAGRYLVNNMPDASIKDANIKTALLNLKGKQFELAKLLIKLMPVGEVQELKEAGSLSFSFQKTTRKTSDYQTQLKIVIDHEDREKPVEICAAYTAENSQVFGPFLG